LESLKANVNFDSNRKKTQTNLSIAVDIDGRYVDKLRRVLLEMLSDGVDSLSLLSEEEEDMGFSMRRTVLVAAASVSLIALS
jgi:hypothetical protein